MKTKHTELAAWRQSHFAELEATLSVLKSIRDDPKADYKSRIEASKSIGRLLSAMSPAKTVPGKGVTVPKEERKPTPDEWETINARLAN